MRELTRRDALAGATVLGVVALAGCVSENNGGDNPENRSESSGADDTDNGNAEPESGNNEEQSLELLDTSFSSAEAEQGRGDTVTADVADGDVIVTGTVPTATPHYEAVLSDATLEGRDLRLVVGAERTLEEGQVGTQPLGVVDYELTLDFSVEMDDLSMFDSFRVEHGGRSQQTHIVKTAGVATGAVAGRGDGRSSNMAEQGTVLASSIVTTNRGCTGGTGGNISDRVDASDEAELSQDGDTAIVQGAVSARTPCHEAFLESVGYGAGTLQVVVGAESNLDRNEYCTECIADIEYEVTVELAEGTDVSNLSVTHIQGTG
jgi:hypothetical protein